MIVTPDQHWAIAEDNDLYRPEWQQVPRCLCLRCGLRVYDSELGLHDEWHDRVGQ